VELTEAGGLFGPRSVSWRVDRELIVLAGGSCALLMQAAHPAVAAGVAQHSTYRSDPFGRLLRTLDSSFSVVFGSRTDALATIGRVNAIHRSVRGAIPETGEAYSAQDPEALLWVHATLVDTALRVYERWIAPLSPEDREAYHRESAQVALHLGVPAAAMPATLVELRLWIDARMADGTIRVTPTAREVAATILRPTRIVPGVAWDAAHLISMSTLRPELRRAYGIRWSHRRQAGVDRLALLSRSAMRHAPRFLRDAPQARAAERRMRQAAGHAIRATG
jgi:uncharacterized protein (DUF2236 family)